MFILHHDKHNDLHNENVTYSTFYMSSTFIILDNMRHTFNLLIIYLNNSLKLMYFGLFICQQQERE